MKIVLRFTLLVVIVIIVACSKKSTPTGGAATMKKADSTSVSANMASADFIHGKAIFSENCGKCHRLYQPNEFKPKEWDNILPGMFMKARVDTSQQRLIKAYVYAGN